MSSFYVLLAIIINISFQMNNYLVFSIEETFCIPSDELYKLDVKIEEENNYTVNWAYIYFITKVPKYRIEKVTSQGIDFIEILLKKNNQFCKVQTKIDKLFRLSHLIPVLRRKGVLENNKKHPVSFVVTKTESKAIHFLVQIETHRFTITIPIQEILINVQITDNVKQYITQPEIIYIGKTLKKIKRFLKHSKLQKSLAVCSDAEDIYIWPTIFKTTLYATASTNKDSKFLETNTDLDIDKKKIDLLEFALIQFFRPIHNEQLKNTALNNSSIIEYYKKYDVNALSLQWFCYQFFCNFWSPDQQIKKTSLTSLHFTFIELGFSDHMIFDVDNKPHFEEFDTQEMKFSNPTTPIDYLKIDGDIIKNW